MTGAWVAASRSTRAVRATIPVRAAGGWNFDSASKKPSLGAAAAPGPLPDITSTTRLTSGLSFVQNVPRRPRQQQSGHYRHRDPVETASYRLRVSQSRPGSTHSTFLYTLRNHYYYFISPLLKV